MQKLEHGRHHEGTHGRGQAPRQDQEQREPPQAWRAATGRGPAAGGLAAGGGPKPRARRSLLASRPTCAAGGRGMFSTRLESHQVDILALALIAIGIFLGGVAYAHWNGGALGDGAVTAIRYLFGALGYAVPAALAVCGALILLRELRPPATAPARGRAVPDARDDAGAGGRARSGSGPDLPTPHVFWHADVIAGPRRHPRTGRVLGLLASDLPPGRRASSRCSWRSRA